MNKIKFIRLYKTLKQKRLLNFKVIQKAINTYHHFGWEGVKKRMNLVLEKQESYASIDPTIIHKILNLDWSLGKEVDARLLNGVTVDIIIPVYKGLEQTRKCILSVLETSNTLKVSHRIIILNDASPDVEVSQFLRTLPQSDTLILIENEVNLGFTATVNKGMQLSDSNDVILLNSDTEVANNWLDKLVYHAFCMNKVATVTPFSNNATICSYPTIHGMKELPEGETTQSLDLTCYTANSGKHIELPTAVGFCMYIRRACLNDIGFFDVETYGKGYGEENDFCIRASQKGWKHLLAADTFVYHEGEVSFQKESDPRKEAAMNILRNLYPKYEQDVMAHIALNEAYIYRLSITIARFRRSDKPVVLHVSHQLGGGTQKHILMLCEENKKQANMLIMTPINEEFVEIRSARKEDAFCIHIEMLQKGQIIALLKMFQIQFIHIHHNLGYASELRYIIDGLQVPFYFTVHDYYSICPRINFIRPGSGYCGEPDTEACNRCLSSRIKHPVNIVEWRKDNAWLFEEASLVICPSFDVMARCKRYYPDVSYKIVPHEKRLKTNLIPKVNRVYSSEPLIILLIGALGVHKGSGILKDAVARTEKYKLPLFFYLVGYADQVISNNKKVFVFTGSYNEKELMDKIKDVNPHLILFTSISPETYCYTLTAALKSGLPIMAPNMGAFPERLSGRPWTWLYDTEKPVGSIIDLLCTIREKHFKMGIAPEIPYTEGSTYYAENFYQQSYFHLRVNSQNVHNATTNTNQDIIH